MNNKTLKQNLMEVILDSWGKFCSICGTQRTEKNIQVIYAYTDGALIHMDCTTCEKQFVLNVVGMGFQMAPVLTDLTNQEIEKFTNTRSVNTDDLIEMHTLLSENSNADALIEQIHVNHHSSNKKSS